MKRFQLLESLISASKSFELMTHPDTGTVIFVAEGNLFEALEGLNFIDKGVSVFSREFQLKDDPYTVVHMNESRDSQYFQKSWSFKTYKGWVKSESFQGQSRWVD